MERDGAVEKEVVGDGGEIGYVSGSCEGQNCRGRTLRCGLQVGRRQRQHRSHPVNREGTRFGVVRGDSPFFRLLVAIVVEIFPNEQHDGIGTPGSCKRSHDAGPK